MATAPASPARDPASLHWLETLIPGVYFLSTVGSLVTFTSAVGIFGSPYHYDSKIQLFIALSWLFFTLSLALATLTSMALTFHRHHVRDAFDRGYKGWRGGAGTRTAGEKGAVFGVLGSGLWLMLLVCLAFVFLSLSVAAYSLAVGWIGVAVSVAVMVLAILFSVFMNRRD